MSTENPFITGMRTNLNAFNAQAEQRMIKRRKARRNRIIGRIVLAVISAVIGLGIGTALTSVDAEATSQYEINQFIRANGGIAPCRHEDGAKQPKPCWWNAKVQGNGEGRSYVIMPGGEDGRIVYLTK